jgi:RES domain-containing protein
LSYASEHQSLAMLEYFVHIDHENPPSDLVLATADVPDKVSRETVDKGVLPLNWRDAAAPPELARFGDEFARKGDKCLLMVASVLAPDERNCLVNPAHPDYEGIVVLYTEALHYDPRMFKREDRRHR